MNPFYADKDTRKELSDVSELIYGRRSQWQKMVREGMTIEEIKYMLEDIHTKMFGDKKDEESK